jgi:hypothetical protein
MKTALFTLCALFAFAAAAHAAPPVIDGNADDLFAYARSLHDTGQGFGAVLVDKGDANGVPQPEAVYSDSKFIPCPMVNGSAPPILSHWVNGTEIFVHAVAYVPGSSTLYIAMRSEGAIGDSDGDGNPDQSGASVNCNPNDNIEDTNGVSGNEFYVWHFDLNCDAQSDATLRLADNILTGTGLFQGVTGTYAFRENAAAGATGHDVEIALNLPAPLPAAWGYRDVQSNAFDGLTEDIAVGVVFDVNPAIELTAAPVTPVCPGVPARIALTVANTGTAPLTIVLTDDLPAGFTYAGKLATDCGTGEPQVDGARLTFPAFDLAPGATCALAFDAASDPGCLGAADHHAEATGTFNSPCSSEPLVTFDDAAASILCDPTPCAPVGTCRLTGGGCMNEAGDRRGHKQSTFGGNSSPAHDGGGPTGNSWEHVYRDGRTILFNWHSPDAHVVGCSQVGVGPCSPQAKNTRADFEGTGSYSLGAGGRSEPGNMVAYVIDHHEGACNKDTRDEYGIVVRKGLAIGQGEVVFETAGTIDCGNLQIHETPARLFGNGATLPGGEGAVALIGRAYPNPFARTTSFAYRVAEGGAPVAIGVYDVAGRLVRALAAGSQAAGIHSVSWDGQGASGARVAPGIYFLKSRIGDESTVQRLVYVAR